MPIYEYRCPNGHLFELFQRMGDPPPNACEICGAAPVARVFHPVPVFFKGSGFYSTDYGRGKRKKEGAEEGGAKGDEAGKKKDEKAENGKKKAAEAS
jgi:putative FmdB family regulatory protein